MASISWNGGTGTWGTASDWRTTTVPTTAGDVTISVSGSYTLTVSAPAFANSLSLNASGAIVTVASTLAIGTNLSLSAGTLSVNGSATASSFAQAGGTLSGTGTVTVSGSASLGTTSNSYLVESGSGTTDLKAGATLGGGTFTPILALDGGRVLQNDATFSWASGYFYLGYNPLDTTVGGATIVNSVGATFNDQTANQIYTNLGTDVFDNAGLFETTEVAPVVWTAPRGN